MEQQIESAAAGNGILKCEYRGHREALPAGWYSIQATVFQVNGLTELQGIIMDISKLKDYEQRLQRERDYYNTLYQNMLCGIAQYAYDEDAMDFIGINPESLRILGYPCLLYTSICG